MAFDEPDVRVLFPVPLLTIRLHGFEALNRLLLKEISKRRRTEPGINRSNRYGWHSATICFGKDPRIEIGAGMKDWSRQLRQDHSDFIRLVIHTGRWGHVSPDHAMMSQHPGALWWVSIRPGAGSHDDEIASGAIGSSTRGVRSNNARSTPRSHAEIPVGRTRDLSALAKFCGTGASESIPRRTRTVRSTFFPASG